MSSSKPSVAVCASVAMIVRSSFSVGIMTEIGIAMAALGAFFGLVEHEIHDDHHGGPKQHLLVPKEN